MIFFIVVLVLIAVNVHGLSGGSWGDPTAMSHPEVLGVKGRNRERRIGWDLIS